MVAGQSGITGFGNGNRCNRVFHAVEGIGSLKTIGNDDVVKFPFMCGLKFNSRGHAVDVFDGIRLDVNIIDRTGFNIIAQIVMTRQPHCGFRIGSSDGDGFGKSCGIAEFISNFKGNFMNTVGQNNVLNAHRIAQSLYAVDSNAVHINFGGVVVKSLRVGGCIVSNIRIKRHYIGGQSLISKFNIGIVGAVSGIGNDRRLTIVHSGTVIQSEVVKVVSHFLSLGRLDIHTENRR